MATPCGDAPPHLATPPGSPRGTVRRGGHGAPPPCFACALSGLGIGMWTSHAARLKLILAPHAFVVLVDRCVDGEGSGTAHAGRVTALWSATLARLPRSPFVLPCSTAEPAAGGAAATPDAAAALASPAPGAARGGVLAFEVQHRDVTGMAYSNPLLLPGRLVLETSAMQRRAFASSAAAADFYASGGASLASPLPDSWASAGAEAAATPQAPPPPLHGATRTLRSKTVVLRFEDAMLPAALKRTMLADSRLLRLVESGLPEWAVFLPAYGLPYRRWLRQAAKAAWVAVGVLSFAAGFHNLCRNIPGAKHALAALYRVSGVPELFGWLERNAQVRLSLLATYLLSESVVLEVALRHASRAHALARAVCVAVAPAARIAVAPPAAALAALLSPFMLALRVLLLGPLRALRTAVASAAAAAALLRAAALAAWHLLAPLRRLLLPLRRLLLPLLRSGAGARSSASGAAALYAAACAMWVDVGASLWRSLRPVVAFSTHVALRLNAHRVSIMREAEARAAALRRRLLGAADASDELGEEATPQTPPGAQLLRIRDAPDGDAAAVGFVLARAASPWEERQRGVRQKGD